MYRGEGEKTLADRKSGERELILCEFEKPLSCFAHCLYLSILASSVGGWSVVISCKQQLSGVEIVGEATVGGL